MRHVEDFRQRIADLSVRPLRFGFLVRRDTAEAQVRNLIMYNSALWGGRYNLFVPTDGDRIREDWWHILHHHDPDVIFLVGDHDPMLVERIREQLQPHQIFIWEDDTLSKMIVEPDKINPILVDSTFREVRREQPGLTSENSRIRYPVIAPGSYAPYFEMMFGQYDEAASFHEILSHDLGASDVDCNADTLGDYLEIIDNASNWFTPLMMSGHDLNVSYDLLCPSSFGIVISDGSIEDRFLYHCLRWSIFGPPSGDATIVLPLEALDSQENVELLANWFGAKVTGNTFKIYSVSVEMDQMRTLRDRLREHLPLRKDGWCIDLVRCNFSVCIPILNNNKVQRIVAVENGRMVFDIPMPTFVKHVPSNRTWIYEFDPSRGAIEGGYAPSMFRDLNFLLSGYPDNASFYSWGSPIRIARGQIAVKGTKTHQVRTLRLPTGSQLIETACRNAGYEVELGNNAYYEGVMQLIGSLREAEFLHNEYALKLFSYKDFIQGQALTLHEINQIVLPRKEHRESLRQIVQDLANRQILLRGYQLQCPVCRLKVWYDLSETKENMICAGCRSAFQLPAQADFSFKLNVLFADRNNNGVITNLLTLILLERSSRYGTLWQAGVELKSGDTHIEIDLLAMCDGILVSAECKNRFLPREAASDKDLENRKVEELKDQLARGIKVARDLSAKLYLFATLDEGVPDTILQFINEQNSRQDELSIRHVTRDELIAGKFQLPEGNQSPFPIRHLVRTGPRVETADCVDRDRTCGNPTTYW